MPRINRREEKEEDFVLSQDFVPVSANIKVCFHSLDLFSDKNQSSHRGTAETNPTRNHELQVRSLASLSGSRLQHCRELWCRSQTWLGPCVAVAVVQAGSYSSGSIPNLGTSIGCRCSPKKEKKIIK